MSDTAVDLAIVGGGLAGGLIAHAVHRERPELRIVLVESGKTIGGNHRWSWFESDLDTQGRALLEPFRQTSWDQGYEVAFPRYRRTLRTGYRSMASQDFHSGLMRVLPEGSVLFGRKATQLDARGITLDDGEQIPARAVVDCRSFAPSPHLEGGWQIFLGRHVRLDQAHGLARPMIMDASVDQAAPYGNGSAYRFVYVLPLGAHDVFVEDTYYADDAKMDRGALSSRIEQYCRVRGWDGGDIVGNEAGILPVLTGGNFPAYLAEVSTPGVALAGARGGFVHPLTSYTLPVAVENALTIAREADLTGSQLAALMEVRAKRHWRKTRYYRLLARMMFLAAEPAKRVRIFQRFYGLRQGLIERFYAGRSKPLDKLRVLSGNPPVPVGRAIAAIFKRGKPLDSEKSA